MADTNEKQPLLPPQPSQKSVVFAENIPKTPPGSRKKPAPPPPVSYKAGIIIMLFMTFLSSVCFSIVLPSIWPFLDKKMHADYSLVGWAVAVNSAGSFLASPFFGWWVDKRSTREIVAVSLIVMIIGNIMYSLSLNIWMLLAGRFVVGVASANYAVAQTYLSYATTVDNRTMVMALNSACTVLGFIIGPAFALGLTYIDFRVSEVEVNAYTSPGYFSAIMSMIGLLALVFLKEISHDKKKAAQSGKTTSSQHYGSGFYSGQGSVKDVSQILKMAKKAQIPWGPVLICLFLYFALTTSFTVFETIGTPYTQKAFHWSVQTNSLMYMVLGALCVLSLMSLQLFAKFLNDRVLLVLFTSFSVVGFAIMLNLDAQYVTFLRFCFGCAFCAASYAVAVAVLISIYSKVLEGLDQGMLMGWLSSSGSIARIIGPITASYCLQYGGPRLVFITMVGLMSLAVLVGAAAYRLLLPRTQPKHSLNAA